jgi:hypothetical protein
MAIQTILKSTGAQILAGLLLSGVMVMAQGSAPSRGATPSGAATVLVPPQGMVPITDRLPAATLQGVIVEVSCFRAKGAATVTSADQIACAKAALGKNTGTLGILTDGDGLFKIVGNLTATNYAKLVPYLGQRVDLVGSEVVISNNYDYHAFDAQKLTPSKK